MGVNNTKDKSSITESNKLWIAILLLLALKLFDKENVDGND